MVVGPALVRARTEAMMIAGTNEPKGKGYSQAMSALLAEYRLDDIEQVARKDTFDIMQHLTAVERWRSKQRSPEALNHPTTVWRRFKGSDEYKAELMSTGEYKPTPAKTPREKPTLLEENVALKDQVRDLQGQLQERTDERDAARDELTAPRTRSGATAGATTEDGASDTMAPANTTTIVGAISALLAAGRFDPQEVVAGDFDPLDLIELGAILKNAADELKRQKKSRGKTAAIKADPAEALIKPEPEPTTVEGKPLLVWKAGERKSPLLGGQARHEARCRNGSYYAITPSIALDDPETFTGYDVVFYPKGAGALRKKGMPVAPQVLGTSIMDLDKAKALAEQHYATTSAAKEPDQQTITSEPEPDSTKTAEELLAEEQAKPTIVKVKKASREEALATPAWETLEDVELRWWRGEVSWEAATPWGLVELKPVKENGEIHYQATNFDAEIIAASVKIDECKKQASDWARETWKERHDSN
jgi:hypothetical protein